jgi:hypothetical protein
MVRVEASSFARSETDMSASAGTDLIVSVFISRAIAFDVPA